MNRAELNKYTTESLIIYLSEYHNHIYIHNNVQKVAVILRFNK